MSWPGKRLAPGVTYASLKGFFSHTGAVHAPQVQAPVAPQIMSLPSIPTSFDFLNSAASSLFDETVHLLSSINAPTDTPAPAIRAVVPPLDWSNVYYLEKDQLDDDEDDNDDEEEEDDVDVDAETSAASKKTSSGPRYLTALRERNGTFIPNPKQLLIFTFPYAKRSTIPMSNLVELAYVCPHTHQRMLIVREYCDRAIYKEQVLKMLKESG